MNESLNDWQEYSPDETDIISPSDWGITHRQTLLYLESCIKDNGGIIETYLMRCISASHAMFAAPSQDNAQVKLTTLRDGRTIPGHDDWSCLNDFIAAGLVKAEWRTLDNQSSGTKEVKVAFTEAGAIYVSQLLKNKRSAASYVPFNTEAVKDN